LVSPHRTKRPWLGQVEKPPVERRPAYDPQCYLCPGNLRAGGIRNPHYTGTFVFENDFAALLPDTPQGIIQEKDLLIAQSEPGICHVVCFSPDHSLTLPQMAEADICQVVDTWTSLYQELASRPEINYVQIFENKGEIMGCSNPHPHGQIWSSYSIPQEPALEQAAQAGYLQEKGSCLLCDYLALELAREERLVCYNDHFLALVPFWAIWPFETRLDLRRTGRSGQPAQTLDDPLR